MSSGSHPSRGAIAVLVVSLLASTALPRLTASQEAATPPEQPVPQAAQDTTAEQATSREIAKPPEIPAPHATLLPVPLPDLGHLERAVQAQLKEMQDSLMALFAQGGEVDTGVLSNMYGQLGQLYHAYELYEPAAPCYRNAHRLAPKEFLWSYALGLLYKESGDLEQAATAFEQALDLSPTDIRTVVRLGEVLIELNRLTSAELFLRRALELDENTTAAWAALGQIALSRGDHQKAVEMLEEALRQVPGANRLHHPLGLAYRGLGDLDKARAHFEQRGKVGVSVVDPLLDELMALREGERLSLLRGKQAFAAGHYAEAVAAFRKAVEAEPESARARVNLSSALVANGEPEEGLEQLRAAIELAPDNATAHYNLGTLLARQGRVAEGILHLEKAIQSVPEDAGAHIEMAGLLRELGQHDLALDHYRKAVELDPLSEGARLGEASVLVNLERFGEALARLDAGLQALPQAGRLASALARLLAASPQADQRDGARALDLAERIFASQSSVQNAVLVALALAELGRCEEAAQWQSKAIEAAQQAEQEDLAQSFGPALRSYQNGPPCRPPATAVPEGE